MKKKGRIGSSAREALDVALNDNEFRIEFEKAGERLVKQGIAEAVRTAREYVHITQGELAKKAKMTQSVISRIENEKLSYLPSVAILTRIARALDASLGMSFIFTGKGKKNKGIAAPDCR